VTLDESTLVQYEKGTVWSPDAVALWGLSRIYNVSLDGLIQKLSFNRRNHEIKTFPNDLLRPESDQASTSTGGMHAAEVADITRELDEFKAALADVSKIAARLASIAVIAKKDGAAGGAATRGHRGGRGNR